jgi:hypothetical protein
MDWQALLLSLRLGGATLLLLLPISVAPPSVGRQIVRRPQPR